jgi:hypothetical protein
VNAVKEKVSNMVVTGLSFWCPYVWDRLAFVTSSELGEGSDDESILRDESRRLDEYPEGHAEFW